MNAIDNKCQLLLTYIVGRFAICDLMMTVMMMANDNFVLFCMTCKQFSNRHCIQVHNMYLLCQSDLIFKYFKVKFNKNNKKLNYFETTLRSLYMECLLQSVYSTISLPKSKTTRLKTNCTRVAIYIMRIGNTTIRLNLTYPLKCLKFSTINVHRTF